jgi:hypothetical protein
MKKLRGRAAWENMAGRIEHSLGRWIDVLTVVDFDNPHTALRTGARVHHGVVNLMIPQIYRDIYRQTE